MMEEIELDSPRITDDTRHAFSPWIQDYVYKLENKQHAMDDICNNTSWKIVSETAKYPVKLYTNNTHTRYKIQGILCNNTSRSVINCFKHHGEILETYTKQKIELIRVTFPYTVPKYNWFPYIFTQEMQYYTLGVCYESEIAQYRQRQLLFASCKHPDFVGKDKTNIGLHAMDLDKNKENDPDRCFIRIIIDCQEPHLHDYILNRINRLVIGQ